MDALLEEQHAFLRAHPERKSQNIYRGEKVWDKTYRGQLNAHFAFTLFPLSLVVFQIIVQ
jgi:hypothetical protein